MKAIILFVLSVPALANIILMIYFAIFAPQRNKNHYKALATVSAVVVFVALVLPVDGNVSYMLLYSLSGIIFLLMGVNFFITYSGGRNSTPGQFVASACIIIGIVMLAHAVLNY